MSSFGTNTRTETFIRHSFIASLIMLCSKPFARHCMCTLLQLVNVTNFILIQPLLYVSTNSVVNQIQIWNAGSHRSGEIKAGVSHSRRLINLQDRCAGALTVLLEDKELARDLTHDRQ